MHTHARTPELVALARITAPDEINARGKTRDGHKELVASIRANGLLQPLLLRESGKKYQIIAGRRRWQALKELNKEDLSYDAVPAIVVGAEVSDEDAIAMSLAENVDRLPMHPVEQYEVLTRFVGTPDDLAARFGLPIRTVRQRLALARMAPEIRKAWKAGQITAEAAQLYADCDEPARQAEVFKSLKGQRGLPWNIRNALQSKRLSIRDAMVKFVGLDAYRAVGGKVTESLFEDDQWIEDGPLLTKLAHDRLRATAAEIAKEGWAWVAVEEDGFPITDAQRFAFCSEEKDKWTKAERAQMGVRISFSGFHGELEIERGLQLDSDEDSEKAKTTAHDWTIPEPVTADAASDTPANAKSGISHALDDTLRESWTVAAAKALAQSPHAAQLVMAASLACGIRSPSRIKGEGHHAVRLNQRDDDCRLREFSRVLASIVHLSAEDLAARSAELIAASINATRVGAFYEPTQAEDMHAVAALMASETWFDAARAAFLPDDYFSRVSRELIEQAQREIAAAGHWSANPVLPAKRKEAAEITAAMAKACGWLPPELRRAGKWTIDDDTPEESQVRASARRKSRTANRGD